jgi:large subunit ribosomal protein L10
MKKAEKTFFVDNLTEEIKAAKGLVVINYAGLNVAAQRELKKRLKEVGAEMVVVKNTLLKRAGEAAKVDAKILEDSVLTGQTALVVCDEDPVSPIQVLGRFAKEYEVPQLKVAIIEGAFQDTESLIKISTLPGRDALLGQVLGTLMSSPYGLVGVLNANMQKLVYILKAKAG